MILATNDDWSPNLAPTFLQVGAASLAPFSNDAALLLELPPWTYTVVLCNALPSRPTLLEIFEVP